MNRLIALGVVLVSLAACTSQAEGPVKLTLMLDWVPNTNHTGIFVAQHEGFFEDAGLEVEIIQPGEVFAEQAVAGGAADFGISFQEQITLARAEAVPLVSIAAIIQNNTSGFASRVAGSPGEWEGLRYGSFGSPFEEPTLR
ncbi:MAG: ABC transporter substrate-binding protein, partial [Chloroflexi bacterium]|nr:ABC transporter substrate-binding protein [Chloroflexota bacterium]